MLNHAGDEAIAHIICTRAPECLWNGDAKQPLTPQFRKNRGIGVRLSKSLGNPGLQLGLSASPRGILDHPFFLAQLILKVIRGGPRELLHPKFDPRLKRGSTATMQGRASLTAIELSRERSSLGYSLQIRLNQVRSRL